MAENEHQQKQHVEVHRKVGLRQRLMKQALDGPVYVPFIGDGDLAVELYTNRKIYGADIEPARTATAAGRLPDAVIKTADCDDYPFFEVEDQFAAADFDAYSYPYAAFKSWWECANKLDRLVLFFTDGHIQRILRTQNFINPDGQRRKVKDITEARELANFYYPTVIKPWFLDFIAPDWKLVKETFYKRGMMLYWGAVIEHSDADIAPGDLPNQTHERAKKFDDAKKDRYIELITDGVTRTNAAGAVGISRDTLARHRRENAEFALRESEAEMTPKAEVEKSLYQAAISGNVTAQQVYLYNRDASQWADRRTVNSDVHLTGDLDIRQVNIDAVRDKVRRIGEIGQNTVESDDETT